MYNKFTKTQHQIVQKIQELSYKIYENEVSINILVEAWNMRKENPKEVLGWDESCDDFKNKYSRHAIKIVTFYHNDIKIRKKYDEYIFIDTNFVLNNVFSYLQNYMLDTLNQKNIIIESMISSNVSISFYKSYYEHHILRWLGIGKYKNYPKPTVVLATDDPGIFATNMRNEIAHLYMMLKSKKVKENEIFRMIEILKNGEIYGF